MDVNTDIPTISDHDTFCANNTVSLTCRQVSVLLLSDSKSQRITIDNQVVQAGYNEAKGTESHNDPHKEL
jgi:hypothetical protein